MTTKDDHQKRESAGNNLRLIPRPKSVKTQPGVYRIPERPILLLWGTGEIEPAVWDSVRIWKDLWRTEWNGEISIQRYQGSSFNKSLEEALPKRFNRPIIFVEDRCSDMASEAYRLTVTEGFIAIEGGSSAGLFYGAQTLFQYICLNGSHLPCCTIEDIPDLKHRGFMHDVTRGKVPTLESLKELADLAASFKLNQLQLYIEHSFAFSGHSEVWLEGDPLSPEDILELDRYCRQRFIQLVPALATFGHLYMALRSRSFSHLCELYNPIDGEFSFIRRQAGYTLNVTDPESLHFVEEMIDQILPLFSSPYFNICGDETFDLGKEKSREQKEALGGGKLYTEFLLKVINLVRKKGKQVQFWGDIIVRDPDLLNELPGDVICLDWDYVPQPDPNLRAVFGNTSLSHYVCPGIVGWNRLVNDHERAEQNIRAMAQFAKQFNADGMINTDWGDYGHLSLFFNLIPGLARGADLSWNISESDSLDEFFSSLGYIQHGKAGVGFYKHLLNAGMQQLFTLRQLVWWLEKEEYYEHVPHSLEDVLEANRTLRYIIEELNKIRFSLGQLNSLPLDNAIIAVEGIALLNMLGRWICLLKSSGESKMICDDSAELEKPEVMAEALETWFSRYSKAWRKEAKESELFRLRDLFIRINSQLRSI